MDLYTDFVLNKRVSAPFQALKDGFAQICCGMCMCCQPSSHFATDCHALCIVPALSLLRPDELETLIRGHPEVDIKVCSRSTALFAWTKTNRSCS